MHKAIKMVDIREMVIRVIKNKVIILKYKNDCYESE